MSTHYADVPAPAESEARLAAAGLGAVAAGSAVLAILQAQWGTLMDGFGLSGAEVPVAAAVLGLFDAAVVLGFLALALFAVGRVTRAPRSAFSRSAMVLAAASLAAVLVEVGSVAAEIAATGSVAERLVTNPGRWTGVSALSVISLSNLALYAALAAGCTRMLRWRPAQTAALVAVVAAVALLAGLAG